MTTLDLPSGSNPMLIDEFRIVNYKSYRDPPPTGLSTGFNVFTGKNNGGKTALLQALSFSTFADKPHRYSGSPPSQPLSPWSLVELTVTLTPADLRRAFLSTPEFYFPVPQSVDPIALFHEFLQSPRSFLITALAGRGFAAGSYPVHRMFSGPQSGRSAAIRPNDARSDFALIDTHGNNNDSVHSVVGNLVSQSVYFFDAQRRSLGLYKFGDSALLKPNAENLPEVLNKLAGSDPDRFDRFNGFVTQVFPPIRRISVRPTGDNLEILVWSADAPAVRADLAITLEESGTGIGQVLAMLYIVVTSDDPRIIIIDEPSTFLHPGAMRQLVEIMRADAVGHQYIIATHSPEIIRVTEAEHVYSVERKDGQSCITPVFSGDITGFRRVLLDLGARLSDLFGADNVLWVEGATEEECFPKIIRAGLGEVPVGLAVLAVRATGDFDGRRASAVAIWEIYHRLSTAGTLMPTALAISLDNEGRSENDIAKAKEMSGGLLRFLPRLCFENYLIHVSAITAVLNALPSFSETPVADLLVETWLQSNGGDAKYDPKKAWNGSTQNSEWLDGVRGALLLHDLFEGLSDAKEQYRKVEHGAAITEWICQNDPEHFAGLRKYLQDLINSD
jgi:hypothetical protein